MCGGHERVTRRRQIIARDHLERECAKLLDPALSFSHVFSLLSYRPLWSPLNKPPRAAPEGSALLRRVPAYPAHTHYAIHSRNKSDIVGKERANDPLQAYRDKVKDNGTLA